MRPGYLKLYDQGLLEGRIKTALEALKSCKLCPRLCRVNRMQDERGFCRTGRLALIASYHAHFGEESPLVGTSGSGTIFFTHCNLLCLFCQNFEISHLGAGREVAPESLASAMIELQEQGCHNINFVTPSHVVAQILEALPAAIERGLRVPLVYNTGGYDLTNTLRILDGIVDIYMPDVKFFDSTTAERLCQAPDYPKIVRSALKEMHRQVGDLELDEHGIARKGLLVRHLVMPEDMAQSRAVMAFLASEISRETYVNVMDQYRPCGQADSIASLGRRITREEYDRAVDAARSAGIHRLDSRERARVFRIL